MGRLSSPALRGIANERSLAALCDIICERISLSTHVGLSALISSPGSVSYCSFLSVGRKGSGVDGESMASEGELCYSGLGKLWHGVCPPGIYRVFLDILQHPCG